MYQKICGCARVGGKGTRNSRGALRNEGGRSMLTVGPSPMKRALFILLLIGCSLSLGACMFMGADDKEFFGKGWVNPKELDTAPPPKMPMRPAADGTPAPTGPSARSDGDWSTPAPF